MPATPMLVVAAVALYIFYVVWRRAQRAARVEHIRHYVLPPGLFEKLRARHPSLSNKDCQLVAQALRQFFLAHLLSGRRFVSMPSQVVDDLWHELILYTRHYADFCRSAFGRFLHHTPAVVLGPERQDNAGLRRVWWHACKEENIDPRKPSRLPLLFAIDTKLRIAGGFRYSANCDRLRANGHGDIYCGGDFSSSSYDGGTDGFGDDSGTGDSGSSSDSSGSSDSGGSSCGGGGCGGGGGGD